ncbi:MAG: CDP-alcohol phosphatidyltransferase family protein [Desulfobulbaceae bacterium]|nr:MAG: CDP-alcohol phosphatidyltransferase family protein [Desulfobulbaceae bacterium]
MPTTPDETNNRRPLKVRSASFAKNFASWLSQKNITPNQISLTSVLFGLLAAICLLFVPRATVFFPTLFLILAALFIQGRLLCNLFDGMVAVEGGKSTAAGELFNDIPDRIADPLIIVATGYAIADVSWGAELGWFTALLSVMTAYIRTLAASIGAPTNFAGPMAKQHRMAIVTIGCVITAAERLLCQSSYALLVVLIIIAVGCIITLYRRTVSAYNYLENKVE